MNWKHKYKKLAAPGKYRIRIIFCFIPTKDDQHVWHWLERVGVVEWIIKTEVKHHWWGNSTKEVRELYSIVDVKNIPNVLEVLGDKLFKP